MRIPTQIRMTGIDSCVGISIEKFLGETSIAVSFGCDLLGETLRETGAAGALDLRLMQFNPLVTLLICARKCVGPSELSLDETYTPAMHMCVVRS